MIDAFVRRHLSRALVARLFVTLTLAGVAAADNELGAQSNPVTARDAWVREAPAGRAVTGMFVTVENSGAAARKIVSGKASVGDTLELHEMKREGGMMQMSPVREIAVPANGKVELRPGGLHLMLFGLKKPLVPGDTVRVELTLDDGSRVSVAAPVRKMGQM
jgi:copper(I)-binding protein